MEIYQPVPGVRMQEYTLKDTEVTYLIREDIKKLLEIILRKTSLLDLFLIDVAQNCEGYEPWLEALKNASDEAGIKFARIELLQEEEE